MLTEVSVRRYLVAVKYLTSSVAVTQVRESPQVSHADCEAEGRHDEVQLPSPRPTVRGCVIRLAPAVTRGRRRKLIFVLQQETVFFTLSDLNINKCRYFTPFQIF